MPLQGHVVEEAERLVEGHAVEVQAVASERLQPFAGTRIRCGRSKARHRLVADRPQASPADDGAGPGGRRSPAGAR